MSVQQVRMRLLGKGLLKVVKAGLVLAFGWLRVLSDTALLPKLLLANSGVAVLCATLIAANRFDPAVEYCLSFALLLAIVGFYFTAATERYVLETPNKTTSFTAFLLIVTLLNAWSLPHLLMGSTAQQVTDGQFDGAGTYYQFIWSLRPKRPAEPEIDPTQIEFYFNPPEPQKYPKSFAPVPAD